VNDSVTVNSGLTCADNPGNNVPRTAIEKQQQQQQRKTKSSPKSSSSASANIQYIVMSGYNSFCSLADAVAL